MEKSKKDIIRETVVSILQHNTQGGGIPYTQLVDAVVEKTKITKKTVEGSIWRVTKEESSPIFSDKGKYYLKEGIKNEDNLKFDLSLFLNQPQFSILQDYLNLFEEEYCKISMEQVANLSTDNFIKWKYLVKLMRK